MSLSLGAGLCLALAGFLSCSGPVPDPRANWSEAKKDRVEAAARQRRIIFNDDSYELSRDDAGTPEGFLKRRLQPLAGTQVDTISWSILGGWADAPVLRQQDPAIYGDAHGGPPAYWSKVTANVKQLIRSGRGPLQIVIDFARSHGMEILASVRHERRSRQLHRRRPDHLEEGKSGVSGGPLGQAHLSGSLCHLPGLLPPGGEAAQVEIIEEAPAAMTLTDSSWTSFATLCSSAPPCRESR